MQLWKCDWQAGINPYQDEPEYLRLYRY